MLAPSERESLNDYKGLEARKRSKLNYVLSKKIRERMLEIDEINEVLNAFNPKTAANVLDKNADNVIAALFRLTETLLRIHEYAPVEQNQKGEWSIVKSKPQVSFRDGSVEYLIKTKPATDTEVARIKLLKEHIDKLQEIAIPPKIGVLD